MFITELTAPTVEPITLDEAKAHIREDASDEEALIEALIVAARQHVEQVTGRALAQRDFRVTWDQFEDELTLPRLPVVPASVVLTYYDGAEMVAFTDFVLSADRQRAILRPAYGAEWPSPLGPDSVQVEYTAGYPALSESPETYDIPQTMKQAMLLLIGHWFEHREAVVTGTIAAAVQFAVNALLAPHLVRFQP